MDRAGGERGNGLAASPVSWLGCQRLVLLAGKVGGGQDGAGGFAGVYQRGSPGLPGLWESEGGKAELNFQQAERASIQDTSQETLKE